MIMPYLSFNGNCEEAFLWYAKIFGGKIQHKSKYGDMPTDSNITMSSEQKRKVMHAQLMFTETDGISGADALWPIENGGAVLIHAHLQNEILAHKVFSALSDGGVVLGELKTNPPPDDSGISGCVKDKYGFSWIVSANKSSLAV